ncbi:hypothetical protein BHM03_00043064, partial [Ensete ventricosum]
DYFLGRLGHTNREVRLGLLRSRVIGHALDVGTLPRSRAGGTVHDVSADLRDLERLVWLGMSMSSPEILGD